MKDLLLLRFTLRWTAGLSLLFATSALTAQAVPTILWTPPPPIPFLTPLSSAQLNARAFAGQPVPVSLASSYNVFGITTNGYAFNTGGFDASGWAYSSELLGPSIAWQGLSFPLGPANAADAVTSTTVPLPSGSFASLLILGDLVNQYQPPVAHFVVNYTDGTSTGFDQSMSDWVVPRAYPGESIAACTPTRHLLDGSTDHNSVCVYGYSIPLDTTRTVQSFTLPQNRNIVLLSMILMPPQLPGTFTYTPASGSVLASGAQTLHASFVPLTSAFAPVSATVPLTVEPPVPPVTPTLNWPPPAPIPPGTTLGAAQLNATATAPLGPVTIPLAPYCRVNALYTDGTIFEERGFDGSGTAFSASLLGPALHFAGGVYPLGPVAVPDAVTSTTITLPAGNFSTLYLMGAAANAPQLAQTITIQYSDGSTSSAQLSLSTWRQAQNFPGETLVASTPYANTSTGQQLAGTFNVYGYSVPVDPARTVSALVLPNNTNVLFLAAGLGSPSPYTVPGTFTYTPAAGAAPLISTTLTTVFRPNDPVDFTGVSGSTPLSVGLLDFRLAPRGSMTLTGITGQSFSVAFAVNPTNGIYSRAITFSVSGNVPPLTAVVFSPASIPADGGPTSVVMTLQTSRLASATLPGTHPQAIGAALCLLLFVPFTVPRRYKRILTLSLAALLLSLVPSGCGTGYADHTYPLTITATDGTYTHTLAVTLHIEASPQ